MSSVPPPILPMLERFHRGRGGGFYKHAFIDYYLKKQQIPLTWKNKLEDLLYIELKLKLLLFFH